MFEYTMVYSNHVVLHQVSIGIMLSKVTSYINHEYAIE